MNREGGLGRKGGGRPEKRNGRRDREDLLPNPIHPSEKQEKPHDFPF
ncbi:MAG: hypothetical protein LBL07_11810 [Tannerella sp.]|nr:hypothetical protein [Tannerella sp.]